MVDGGDEERPLDEIPALVADGTIKHSLVVCAFFHLAGRGLLAFPPAGGLSSTWSLPAGPAAAGA